MLVGTGKFHVLLRVGLLAWLHGWRSVGLAGDNGPASNSSAETQTEDDAMSNSSQQRILNHLNAFVKTQREAVRWQTKTHEVDGVDDVGRNWGSVEMLSAANIESKLLRSPDTWVVQWCTWQHEEHCMKDTLAQVASQLAGVVRVGVVNPADAERNDPFRLRFGVVQYPTIHGFETGGGERRPDIYTGSRTVAALVAWAMGMVPAARVRKILDPYSFLRHTPGRNSGGPPLKVILFHGGGGNASAYRALANRFSATPVESVRGSGRLMFGEVEAGPHLAQAGNSEKFSFGLELRLPPESWPALVVINTSTNIAWWPHVLLAWQKPRQPGPGRPVYSCTGRPISPRCSPSHFGRADMVQMHDALLAMALLSDLQLAAGAKHIPGRSVGGPSAFPDAAARDSTSEGHPGRATEVLNRYFTVAAYGGGQFDPAAFGAVDFVGTDYSIRNVLALGEDAIHASKPGAKPGHHDLLLRSRIPVVLTHVLIAGPRASSSPIRSGLIALSHHAGDNASCAGGLDWVGRFLDAGGAPALVAKMMPDGKRSVSPCPAEALHFRTDEGIRKFSQPLPGALNPARGATHIHVHVGAAGAEESNIDIASIVLVGFVHASRAGDVDDAPEAIEDEIMRELLGAGPGPPGAATPP